MKNLFQWIADQNEVLPPLLIAELTTQYEYYNQLNVWIKAQEEKLLALNKENYVAQLL